MDTGNPIRDVPIGQSGAASIAVCALYVVGAAATITSWIWSKFEFYEVRSACPPRAHPPPGPPDEPTMTSRSSLAYIASAEELCV